MKMEKYRLYRNKYIFVVYVQNSGIDVFCCEDVAARKLQCVSIA